MTADSLGNLMFMVAIKREMTVKISHRREKSFGDLKLRAANGTASRYTADK